MSTTLQQGSAVLNVVDVDGTGEVVDVLLGNWARRSTTPRGIGGRKKNLAVERDICGPMPALLSMVSLSQQKRADTIPASICDLYSRD